MSKIPSGFFSRGGKLALAASKLALHEVSSKLKTWETEKEKLEGQIEAAKALVKTLSELKGASLKMGQLISLDLGDILPPAVVKIFENLHQNAAPLPYEEIQRLLRAELKAKLNDFSEISTAPLATASIGQVHRAKLFDRDVVLKIQYPNVAESIPQDVKVLRLLLNQFNLIQGKKIDFSDLLGEVSEILKLETDYVHELRMLKRYRENFKDDPNFLVPEPFDDYCTEKVLCLEFMQGVSINKWLETASLEQRTKIAHQFISMYLQEFFVHGLVQTDPNPGNFLVTPSDQIILLDFGAVREFDRDFIEGYKKIIEASIAGDEARIMSESERLKFIDPRESDEVRAIFLRMMDLITKPFASDEAYDFSNKALIDESQKLSWELIRKGNYSPPPKDLLFLHRKLAGTFVIIRKLGVPLSLREYWLRLN